LQQGTTPLPQDFTNWATEATAELLNWIFAHTEVLGSVGWCCSFCALTQ